MLMQTNSRLYIFFFFNDTATTEIYTLSLHDALPISPPIADDARMLRQSPQRQLSYSLDVPIRFAARFEEARRWHTISDLDRKSTRLNSSHANISYAVFCLKKKKHNTSNSRRC